MPSLDRKLIKYLRCQHFINGTTCKAVIAIAIAIAFILTTLYLSSPPDKGYENRQYSECNNPYSNKDVCIDRGATSSDSAEKNHDATNTSQYQPNTFIKDKRDLNAQEGMWRATYLLAIFTLFQVFIGLAGVVVVALTLRQTAVILEETRKTTAAANRSTEAALDTLNVTKTTLEKAEESTAQAREQTFALRGYVGFSDLQSVVCRRYGSEFYVEQSIELKNYGQTIARDVKLFFQIKEDPGGKHYMGDANFRDMELCHHLNNGIDIAPSQPKSIHVRITKVSEICSKYKGGGIYFFGAIQYRTIYSETIERDFFVIRLDLALSAEDLADTTDPNVRVFNPVQIPGKVNW